MSDINFLERQALERATHINKNTYNPKDNLRATERPEKIRPRVTKLPIEFPDGYSFPDFKTTFGQEKKNQIMKQNAQEGNIGKSNLSKLLNDPEAAMLSGLIMLLRNEGADEALLAALGYILL
ncbi:MAG: hypothetical protein J1F24_00525 [Oscillospiraceae bacterium]|nr:hypothetical protein [Oscillospiraceae bacterium]